VLLPAGSKKSDRSKNASRLFPPLEARMAFVMEKSFTRNL